MEDKRNLTIKEKASYGLGAVGKDMVYMLSATYVLYYFQDVMGVSAVAMGIILLAARVFDAFNDPIMGIIVAKTKTKMGRFRPWLLIGTLTNSLVLFLMFSCPPSLDGAGLTAYAAIFYILWGVTYTMMDIPFWSMIPAFTKGGKERENLTTLARSCSGVGSAIIMVITMMVVHALGNAFAGADAASREIERTGFSIFSLIVAVLFSIFIIITCVNIKEKSTVDVKTATVGEMFKALFRNDQAVCVVVAIVIVNCSIYITSNLVIYFFKYDFGGVNWYKDYTYFSTFGGAMQIIAMMIFYPLLRKFFNSIKIYFISIVLCILGYASFLIMAGSSINNVFLLFIPAFFIFSANGMLSVLTTVFLANTVDYGEVKNGRRDESVIFSMQTFVVKLASGVSAFIASITLAIFSLSSENSDKAIDFSKGIDFSQKMGLRMVMTIIPVIGLIFAFIWFKKKYILTDEKLEELSKEVERRKSLSEQA